MADKAKKYEFMVIVSPELVETQKELAEIKKLLTDEGAEIYHEDDHGLRELAYPIKGHQQGYYAVYNFTMENGSKFPEIEHEFNINNSILRYMIVKEPKGYTPTTLDQYDEEFEAELEREKEEKEQKAKESRARIAKRRAKAKSTAPAKPKADSKPKSKKDMKEVDEKLKSIVDDPDISI